MKAAHFGAIVWLRWRILKNRVSRRGRLGNTLITILAIFAVFFMLSSFAGTFLAASSLLPEAKPVHIRLAWAGATGLTLLAWMAGVMTELQRSESVPLQSLLHLPSSLLEVHIFNYIGSFVSVSLFFTLPILFGFAFASVYVLGGRMLLLLPLIAGFVFLLTAVTYQLRGWLETLMKNKRKRRNVIVLITISFVLLAQTPSILNIISSNLDTVGEPLLEGAGVPTDGGGNRDATERTARKLAIVDTWVGRACVVVPFGWLAWGAGKLIEGKEFYALLCILGMFGLAALSLRRSYHTTIDFVTGAQSGAARSTRKIERTPTKADRAHPLFVARVLPLAGEETAAFALATMRNLLRTPEFKMLLVLPLILVVLGIVIYLSGADVDLNGSLRPAAGLLAMAIGPLSMLQLLQNQFAVDRDAFLALVLCPAPRHRILLGKNLAVAPFVLGTSVAALLGSQLFVPMGVADLLATLLLAVAMFLLIAVVTNFFSLLNPIRIREGSLRPVNTDLKSILLQLAILLLLPVILFPIAFPMLLEWMMTTLDPGTALPVYPLASFLVLLASLFLYIVLIYGQGRLLHEREQRMLEILIGAGG